MYDLRRGFCQHLGHWVRRKNTVKASRRDSVDAALSENEDYTQVDETRGISIDPRACQKEKVLLEHGTKDG